MPKSLLRAPARLLVIAVAVGAPTLAVAPAHASPGAPTAAPGSVVATLAGDDVTVTWDAFEPADPNDSDDEVVSYVVDSTPGVTGGEETVSATAERTVTFADQGPGRHTFTVTAADSDTPADPANAVESNEVYILGAPSNVAAASASPRVARVTWTAPTVAPDESPIAYYAVTLDAPGDDNDRTLTTEGAETTLERANVAPGTYAVTVVAGDSAGNESVAASAPQPLVVADWTAPEAPTELSAKQFVGGELEVEWSYPSDDHDFDITSYVVQVVRADGSVVSSKSVSDDFRATLTKIPAGTYAVLVTAKSNGADATARLANVVVKEGPAKVNAFKVVQTGPGEVTVTWKRPSSGTVTGYAVGYGTGESGNGVNVGASTFSQKFTKLRPGRYTFGVSGLDGDILGASASSLLEVTNYVKKGGPSLALKDATLKPKQKLVVTGKAKPGSFVTLEYKPAGGKSFFYVAGSKAAKSGAYKLTAGITKNGAVRVVEESTGRSTLAKNVKVSTKGR